MTGLSVEGDCVVVGVLGIIVEGGVVGVLGVMVEGGVVGVLGVMVEGGFGDNVNEQMLRNAEKCITLCPISGTLLTSHLRRIASWAQGSSSCSCYRCSSIDCSR